MRSAPHRQLWRCRPGQVSPFMAVLPVAPPLAVGGNARWSFHFSNRVQQGAAFQYRYGVKPGNPTLFFALDAFPLPEVLAQISVIVKRTGSGKLNHSHSGHGPAASRHGLKGRAVPVF